jgi:UDP-glucose:(heptosyl)LPS alpha-1,3-glucosyltransferase
MDVTICCKRFGITGGAEAFLGNLVRALLGQGHGVKVIAAEFTGDVGDVATQALRVPPVPKLLQDVSLARASASALARETADVTFSDQKCWGADVVRPGGGVQREYFKQWERSHRTRGRMLLQRVKHAVSLRDRFRLHIDDRLFGPPGPRAVIANSDMVRRHLLRHYHALAGRVHVVYNGADTARFTPRLKAQHRQSVRSELGIPPDALTGVFVGTGWQRKGLYPFIEAIGLIARKHSPAKVYGIVVGRGPRRRAEAFARRQGADGLLRFVGQTPAEPYYGAADLLVLPSYFDACANVTLEGLACGLPVVTSVHNGAFDLITPGREGFHVDDPSDAGRLADLIRRFAEPDFLGEASRNARALAMRYPLEGQLEQIVAVLQEVADAKASLSSG